MRIRYFFENLFDWMRWHVWQTVLICFSLVVVISAAIVVPIMLFSEDSPISINKDDDYTPAGLDDGKSNNEPDPEYVEHDCTFSKTFSYDDTYHWRACTFEGCKAIYQKGTHTLGNDGKCEKCAFDAANHPTDNVDGYSFIAHDGSVYIEFTTGTVSTGLSFTLTSTETSPIRTATIYQAANLESDKNTLYSIQIEDKENNVHKVSGSSLTASTQFYLVINLIDAFKTSENISASFTYLPL